MPSLKALIIEDETAAAINLRALLREVDPSMQILEILDTVTDSIHWFRTHPLPDLVFMDIHLSDGQAFKIFEQIEVECPIVFTTAYDQYALDAFKVNSIDYLLKPIKREELERALEKLQRLSTPEISEYMEQTRRFITARAQSFLIPFRDRLVPLLPDQIAFFYTAEERVTVTTLDGRCFPMDRSLDTLMTQLSPSDFFRANRQFIVARRAIADLSVWFGSRLSLNLSVKTEERIVVSKARVPEFKQWFTGI
ncbi:MAG: LytTR family DNA-binding domain-containing protein [Alistipes sp.]|nr:LytTR family DNA-binding domain-containing protein [Alistipes sp.]